MRFKNKSLLREHLRIHESNVELRYRYECEKCMRRFTQPCTLQQHNISVHGPPAKFPCSECQKGFATKYQLRKHLYVHQTNVELKSPYICDECEGRFTTKGSLRRHELTHETNVELKSPLKLIKFMIEVVHPQPSSLEFLYLHYIFSHFFLT